MLALKAEIGATDLVVNTHPSGTWWVMGAKFPIKDPPDRSLWKRVSSMEGVWKPKADTPLDKRFKAEFVSDWIVRCKQLLGVPEHDPRVPGMHFLPDALVIEWSSDCWAQPPVGCTRISDIEFEAMTLRLSPIPQTPMQEVS